jgi:hypothetical protein
MQHRQKMAAAKAGTTAASPRVIAATRRCFVVFRPHEAALDVFNEYLRLLEEVVLDAEKRYS